MLKLAMQVPVLTAAVLGGSLILPDGMIVAALMVSFVSLVLVAAIGQIIGSARSHGPISLNVPAGAKASAPPRAPYRRP